MYVYFIFIYSRVQLPSTIYNLWFTCLKMKFLSIIYASFEAIRAVLMKIQVFWTTLNKKASEYFSVISLLVAVISHSRRFEVAFFIHCLSTDLNPLILNDYSGNFFTLFCFVDFVLDSIKITAERRERN